MKLTFCGGASEVGASCMVLNICGKNLVFDCGVRFAGTDSLPDLQSIPKNQVDAIFVSHAHMDHGGGLPVLSTAFPNAPIYTTHATSDLLRVLLYDSLKIMEHQENEIPSFAEVHVRSMLSRIICHSPNRPFYPLDRQDKISAVFYPAGHIAGAACIHVTTPEGTFFYSGDLSMQMQRTVTGASIPKIRPDVAVLETTYGDRLHANRKTEEQRLVQTAAKVLGRGGKLLVPAFALGRAQEVLLILKAAMNKGDLPKIPIYVDGMVRDICRVYKLNPNYLHRFLGARVRKNQEIFYDEQIQPVQNKRSDRQNIVKDPTPCVIVSSSGMLSGGPSPLYAQELAKDPKNYIAITGYQDEESPGRALLSLSDEKQEERVLPVGKTSIPILCEFGQYGLSAHADRTELEALVHALRAKHVYLVHGNASTMQTYAKQLQKDYKGNITVPQNGEAFVAQVQTPGRRIEHRKWPSLHEKQLPHTEGQAADEDAKKLHAFVTGTQSIERAFTVEDLYDLWTDLEPITKEAYDLFVKMLENTPYFEPELRRPYLYHAVDEEKLTQESDQPMEVNRMLAYASEVFGKDTGLYKAGANIEEKTCLLTFDFPTVAKQKTASLREAFEAHTGWKTELNSEVNLHAANALVRQLIPSEYPIVGDISYYREEERLVVKLSKPMDEQKNSDIRQTFFERTGLTLDMVVQRTTIPLRNNRDEHGKMEQNAAMAAIDQAFLDIPDRIYKKSLIKKDERTVIALSFLSPQVGKRHEELLSHLSEHTGWEITIRPLVNQNEILQIAQALFEKEGLVRRKNFSYLAKEQSVTAYLDPSVQIKPETVDRLCKQFSQKTGLFLKIE